MHVLLSQNICNSNRQRFSVILSFESYCIFVNHGASDTDNYAARGASKVDPQINSHNQ